MSTSGKQSELFPKKGIISFKSSLGRMMVFSLMTFTILPVLILSTVLYIDGKNGISEVSHNVVINNAATKSAIISRVFQNTKDMLEAMANDEGLATRITRIRTAAPTDSYGWIEYLETPDYNDLTGPMRKQHLAAIGLGEFNNILFLDIKGNVLYAAKESLLPGSDMLHGKYSHAQFEKVFLQTLKSNEVHITDIFPFGPQAENTLVMMRRVVQNEKTTGIIAAAISLETINTFTSDPTGMGETGEVFFMGSDLLLRSQSRFMSKERILKEEIDNPVVDLYHEQKELEVIQYVDEKGIEYFATWCALPVLKSMGLDWPLVLMIHSEEIDTFSGRMRKHMTILIGVILLLTITISITYSDKLLYPILQLVRWVHNISIGDLSLHQVRPVSKDFKEMATNVENVANTFRDISKVAQAISVGDYSRYLEVRHENDNLSKSINQMKINLEEAARIRAHQLWIKDGESGLYEIMRGDKEIELLTKEMISFITRYLNAQIGALYLLNPNDNTLVLTSSYAFTKRKGVQTKYAIGEGLIGQCAREKEIIQLSPVPDDYLHITSGLGNSVPKFIIVAPIQFEDELIGVIEMGSIHAYDDKTAEFLMNSLKSMGISLHSAKSRAKVRALLEKTQAQAEKLSKQQEELRQTNEELQVQQEELRVANEELEEQTKALKKSEQELQGQQEELRVINEELEEKTKSLELQKKDVLDKNMELEVARANIEQKAKELEISSKYKSEFLANMSHELRTPLNSLLILSRDLADNHAKNLNADQLESAEIIYKSGNDLLILINEILDLSKIESGKMSLTIARIEIQDIVGNLNMQFRHVAEEKGLYFKFDIDDELEGTLMTDQQRLEQILKNIVSNAMKFTHEGGITLKISRPDHNIRLTREGLTRDKSIAFSVIDTGIGIPEKKQLAIFEAFQQADGSTSRKYGGTGLGLSISRELAKLLGGEITLQSEIDKGSVFSLIVPLEIHTENEELKEKIEVTRAENKARFNQQHPETILPSPTPANRNDHAKTILHDEAVEDDRDDLLAEDKKILIIEDDRNFAQTLRKQSREKGFKSLIALTGETGLKLAKTFMPDAIILDLKLPGIDGINVLEILKDEPKTRHIPVHMMSAYEETIDALKKGAIGYLMKPPKADELEQVFTRLEHYIQRKMKDLLLVEDDKNMRKSIKMVIGDNDVNIHAVDSGNAAIKALETGAFDCMVLDLGLPDMTGFELLKKLDNHESITLPPVIVYTGKELTREENELLQKYTNTIIIKGVKSEERLLDETALFLHRIVDKMPQKQRKMITNLHDKDALFTDKKILVVDDDMRNVFALSKILTNKGMKVSKAVNGKMAMEVIEKEGDFDLVLLDIMMPEMDGYETTRRLRENPRFRNLPVIALTAKAMKDDRQKCIDAGANDYLSKPVNVDKLLSLMRVWLYQ